MRNQIISEDLKNIINFNLPWHKFYGKTVLVTGAAGMLPAYMVETLLYLNEQLPRPKIKVLGLVLNKASALKRFSFYQKREDLKLITSDVSKNLFIPHKLDYIIHAASFASPKFYGKNPVGTLLPNVLGTYQVLELARKKKVKGVLFFSSGEVYGQAAEGQGNFKENEFGYLDPAQVRSCYAESKRLGETMCVSWWRQYKVPVKIVRPFHTFGPGMKLDDGRVFADFVASVVKNRNIVLNSDGKAVRTLCYIADATKGFFTLLLKGQNGQPYNIGNDKQQISIFNLAKLVAGLFPEKNLKVVIRPKSKSAGYLKSPLRKIFPNISKIASLGWRPETSLAQGFKRTIESFNHKN